MLVALFGLYNFVLSAQCVADAGSDGCIASPNFLPIEIGGNPTASGGQGPYTYTWQASDLIYSDSTIIPRKASDYLDDSTAANPKIINFPNSSIEFFLTVKDQNDMVCLDTVRFKYNKFLIILGQKNYFIEQGDSVYLTDVNVFGYEEPLEYLWSPNHGLTDSTSLEFWAKPDTSTNYSVRVTDADGCVVDGGHFHLVTVMPVSTNTLATNQKSIIFPNPNSGIFNLQFQDDISPNNQIDIFDLMGKMVLQSNFYGNRQEIDANHLPNGVYFIQIKNSDSGQILGTERLIINK